MGLHAQPEALELIALQGTGAMRDAISLLDQLASYGDEITLDQVQRVLGTAAGAAAGQLAACLAGGDLAGGLDLINRTVADGVDPRQFGREVVEYLRSLLLVHEGAGTRLLHTTAEQAAEMEALAGRLSLERLVRAIRLFNEAATDLRRGFQTIPQLPLELALVGSLTGRESTEDSPNPEAQPVSQAIPAVGEATADQGESAAAPPHAEAQPSSEATTPGMETAPGERESAPALPDSEAQPISQPAPTRAPAHRVAEGAAPPLTAGPSGTQPASTASRPVSLDRLRGDWEEVLRAVRRLNPTAEGALRSGCEPVEVHGNEVVVTFPYPFLKDKLGDPARKMEIQEALGEVLGIKCQLKLVLASEHRPSRPANPAPQAPQAGGGRAAPSGVAGSGAADAAPEMADQDLDKLYRWAEEMGGQVIEE